MFIDSISGFGRRFSAIMMGDETDDDLYENWEDLVDTGALDKKLEIMKPRVPTEQCSDCRDSLGCTQTVILQDDGSRTQFVPPQPQVKILKRPTGGSTADGFLAMNGEKQKQPIKTLQQREAEYAEARLRILGSAKSDEEIAEERLARITLAATTDTSPKAEVPRSSDSSATESIRLVTTVQVTRAPRGPDGTSGFMQFR